MIRNYFKTAWRNLWKNKSTSFINLFGLSVGMTAAVLIFLWVQNEFSFDNLQPGKRNIYRITNIIHVNNNEDWIWESSPLLMADAATKEIPEVEKASRVIVNDYAGPVFTINHKLFSEKTTAIVEKAWFNMFHYDFVAGSPSAFAQNPFSVILTESKARKYFGDVPAVGQVIRIDTVNYTVEGVIKDNPINSSFQFDVLMQMDGRLADPKNLKNDKSWGNFTYITFLALRNDANKSLVETKLNDILQKNKPNHKGIARLEPLSEMYFESDLQSSSMPHGNKKTTYIFSLLGLLLLITACINYVNLTTARASLRAREVSVRKIIGAERKHLFSQFIAESLCISFISLLLTLLLIQLCLPTFNAITEKHFSLPITSIAMWRILLGTLLVATIMNGIYPALLLSSFNPMNVFRGKSLLRIKDGTLRKALVVFQFSLSVALIMATIVIYRQLSFIQKKNPGYNVSQVMSMSIPWKSYGMLDAEAQKSFFLSMKKELQSQSSIMSVSTGGSEIVNVGNASSGNADWDGRDTTFNPTLFQLSADADFQKMFGIQMKAGRWFNNGTQDIHNYILNESAAEQLTLHKPIIGQRFTYGGDTGRVIGIVKDFHYKNLHEKIGPLVINYNGDVDAFFFLKTVPGSIPKSISAAESVWSKYIPGQPFAYTFLDDSFNTLYKNDIKTSKLIFIFSLIAVIISALGLFGLATFTAEQRTKEIGIRKVLGASVGQLTGMLSKDFVKLVLVAIGIGSPLAWWLMNKWLQDFAYRIHLTVWILLAAGSVALLIAIVSVSTQAIRASIANPVRSLRNE